MIIGIGAGSDVEKVLQSISRVKGIAEIVCYCQPGTVVPGDAASSVIIECEEPESAMVSALMDGTIDAAVRGSLPANTTLGALRESTGVDHLVRIALLETASGQKFFLAPVGIDEGWTIPEKVELIGKGRELARKFGMNENVAVLSGGRYGDVGRNAVVDQSLAAAELAARLTGAVHMEILIEEAVETCGVIIAPDGISGNLIFRTLVFLGDGTGHGAPIVNIGKIFVDTSRASPDYANALLLAAALLK